MYLGINFMRFLDMEIDAVEDLVFRVIEQVAADNCDLDKVIEYVVSFSYEHSLSADTLLKLSFIFDKNKMHRVKYVISRACASLFSGRVREDALTEAGKTANVLGFGELAAQEFEEVLKENPERIEAISGYGIVLAKMGKLDAARVKYEKALELDPYHVNTLCNLGWLLFRLKRIDEAEEAYKRVLILDSSNVDAHCRYGILLSKNGQKIEANYHYTQALKLDPDHVESNFRYARFLEEKGEPLEAERHYIVASKRTRKSKTSYVLCTLAFRSWDRPRS